MNLNTIDPLLYRDRSNPVQDRITDYNKMSEEKKSSDKSSFLEQLNKSLDKGLPADVRNKISTSHLNLNMSKAYIENDIKNSPDKQKLFNAAKEFESFFVEKMFVEMKKNVPKNKMFHGGPAEDIFDDMLLSERVRKVSDQSDFGLAELMYQQLSIVY